MAKITFEFDTNDDRYDLFSLYKIDEIRNSLDEIHQIARSALKHGEAKDYEKCLEDIKGLAGQYEDD